MRFIGQPFKTPEGAAKRARFENNHPQPYHVRKYWHHVVKDGDVWRVVRTTTPNLQR